MATIIDSLLVTLGLDSTSFDANRKKVDKGLSDTGKQAESTAKTVAGFLAVVGGTVAIQRFVSDTIRANAELARLSLNLNEGVQSISAWSNAAEEAGGSAQGLQSSMDMLSKAQTELQLTGQSSLIPYFSSLGLSLADVEGRARPVGDLLLDLSGRFERMDRTTANNLGRMMGLDQGTMNLLLKGRHEVELMIARQKEHSAVTKKQAEEAERLQRLMITSRQSFEAFGRSLLSEAIPYLEKLLSVFDSFGRWIAENQEVVKVFLTIVAAGLAAIAAYTVPINLTVTAVLALAAAIAALYQDYQTFKRGGDSLIDWAKWEPGIEAAKKGLGVLRDLLVDMLIRAVAVGDAILKLATGDFSGAKIAANAALFGIPGEGLQKPAAAPQAPAASPAKGDDRQRFIATAAARLGVPEAVIDAHLRTETGATGKTAIGDFNFGNIKTGKGYAGASKSRSVLEYDANGRPLTETAAFRSYGSPEAAAADYADLIARRYPGAKGATDATTFASALKAGGYATDPNYVAKIAAVARGIPGASQAATGAVRTGQAATGAAAGGKTVSVENKIGEVKVYTQATDAAGIAKDLGGELDYLFVAQANYGQF